MSNPEPNSGRPTLHLELLELKIPNTDIYAISSLADPRGLSVVIDFIQAREAAIRRETELTTQKVDRFEVIDDTGRAYVKGSIYGTPVKVELSYQDDNRTLKVFIQERAITATSPDPEATTDADQNATEAAQLLGGDDD